MFGSNVSPKKIMKQVDQDDWECHKCSSPVRYYLSKCLSCGGRRRQDDNYRKGGTKNGSDSHEGC